MSDQVTTIAKAAPHWAALVLVVGGFLWYLDRSSGADDIVARQRIEACHAIQLEANQVLSKLNETLTKQAIEDARLRETIERFEQTLERHTAAVERLLGVMER